jgi:hypothetical protein
MQRVGRFCDGIHLHFRADARGSQERVFLIKSGDGVVLDRADEVRAPLLYRIVLRRARFCVYPVQMRLQVAVGAGDVADF